MKLNIGKNITFFHYFDFGAFFKTNIQVLPACDSTTAYCGGGTNGEPAFGGMVTSDDLVTLVVLSRTAGNLPVSVETAGGAMIMVGEYNWKKKKKKLKETVSRS